MANAGFDPNNRYWRNVHGEVREVTAEDARDIDERERWLRIWPYMPACSDSDNWPHVNWR